MGKKFDDRIASIIGEEEVWLTPDDVSRITGFKVGTLNTWRARRKGPPARVVGRSIRYSSHLLRMWMNEQGNMRRGTARD